MCRIVSETNRQCASHTPAFGTCSSQRGRLNGIGQQKTLCFGVISPVNVILRSKQVSNVRFAVIPESVRGQILGTVTGKIFLHRVFYIYLIRIRDNFAYALEQGFFVHSLLIAECVGLYTMVFAVRFVVFRNNGLQKMTVGLEESVPAVVPGIACVFL